MKPKLIVYKVNSDEIAWVSPNDESMSFILSRVIPSGSNYLFVEELEDNPNYNDIFFSAYDFDWSLPNGTIANVILDVEKAKTKFLFDLRAKREEVFSTLDVEFMKALETGNQTEIQRITTKKQQLRDATNIDFSNVTNVNDLISKWPTNLLGISPYNI